MSGALLFFSFFFFNDTATTEIYTLSLHDALPISSRVAAGCRSSGRAGSGAGRGWSRCSRTSAPRRRDRKSTRLNSSHVEISYAVFCLKKKNQQHVPCYNQIHRKVSDRLLQYADPK